MRPRFAPSNPQPSPPPRLWSPPQDPEKPACPYQARFAVEIKRHTPPPPFGDPQHGPGAWRERSDVHLYSATQTEVVMAYPSLECENTLSSSPAPTATLTILRTLAVADGRGPQLVVCSVAPKTLPKAFPQAPYEAVAKIFDPLYYSFENKEAAHVPVNVAWQADVHYTHEAAAYDHLHRTGQTGLFAPEYFGSWTFTLPITHARRKLQRSVRLVLMENIKGPSIWSVCHDPAALSGYTEQDRLDIFAKVLDGIVRQRHAGVDQRDPASRNVILRPSSSLSASNKQPLPQPVIIDYNTAVVFELTRLGKRPFQLAKLPENPMEVFWNTSLADFQGWTPSKWNGNAKLRQQWLKERFGGKAASQYA
ncbi:hypothetical protein QBC46DRAFT_391304 [Diplogelasinospora grovesii]|uniref:Uncharacterized protein n=1 Tax=Diplogelasinospora grovesii TaxID=303347 RepID=A0AAN6S1R5_9PEZI|nr:hypothetical protein QBC46DRAFT_391304 [Diplogelasinospora grovesii]